MSVVAVWRPCRRFMALCVAVVTFVLHSLWAGRGILYHYSYFMNAFIGVSVCGSNFYVCVCHWCPYFVACYGNDVCIYPWCLCVATCYCNGIFVKLPLIFLCDVFVLMFGIIIDVCTFWTVIMSVWLMLSCVITSILPVDVFMLWCVIVIISAFLIDVLCCDVKWFIADAFELGHLLMSVFIIDVYVLTCYGSDVFVYQWCLFCVCVTHWNDARSKCSCWSFICNHVNTVHCSCCSVVSRMYMCVFCWNISPSIICQYECCVCMCFAEIVNPGIFSPSIVCRLPKQISCACFSALSVWPWFASVCVCSEIVST